MYLLQNILITVPLDKQFIRELFLTESGLYYKNKGRKCFITNVEKCKFFMVDDDLNTEATLDWTPNVAFQYFKEKEYLKKEFQFLKV